MPSPPNSAPRLIVDGQRTCVANQSISYTKLHDQLSRPSSRPATSATTVAKSMPNHRHQITESLSQARFLPDAA